MQHFKNALILIVVILAGAGIGVFGARWMLAESPREVVEALPQRPAQLAAHVQPVVFTLSTCPACAKLKAWLGEQRIDYVEYSLDTDAEADRLARELDIDSVPVVFTASHRINGFVPTQLALHLAPAPNL
jgi:glutaredoxin